MIKVIGKKKEEKKVYKTFCDECRAELEFEESDTYIGTYGCRELICPECGEKVLVENLDGIDLDENNIEFPVHFSHTSDTAKNIDNNTIQEWARTCLKEVKEDTGSDFHMNASGDTVVIALRYGDGYGVYVAKQYYDCEIPL